jgi:hypothetical protein
MKAKIREETEQHSSQWYLDQGRNKERN